MSARVLADVCREANVERYFVAGLLHDIGRLVLHLGAPDVSREVIAHAGERAIPLHQAERELTGMDHGTIGGWLMERWSLPESLREAVGLHHRPEEAKAYPREAAVVHLADVLAHEMELGRSGERQLPVRSPAACQTLSIEADRIDALAGRIEREYRDAVRLFGFTA